MIKITQITLLIAILALISVTTTAQTYTEKTIDMKPGFTDQVFYSMVNGEAGRSSIYNWDIAFTNNLRDNGVRANHMNGVAVYAYTKGDTGSWTSFDTIGWAFKEFHNSTSNLDKGAFNQTPNPSNGFDFSWGVYNPNTHAVTGDSLFMLVFRDQNQAITGMKKFWLVKQTSANGNLTIRLADIDGSNDTTVELTNTGADYNFTYYDLRKMKPVLREPVKTTWDITFTRWMQYLGPFSPIPYFPSTGVNSNYNTLVAKNHTLPSNEINPWNERPNAVKKHDLIGVDWKYYNRVERKISLEDSLTYTVFPDSTSIMAYPFYFSSYEGMSTGVIKINQGSINLGVNEIENIKTILFPNPVSGNSNLNISLDENLSQGTLELVNVNGQVLLMKDISNLGSDFDIELNSILSGLYFVRINSIKGISTTKLSIY
jgi:hypothetical protein